MPKLGSKIKKSHPGLVAAPAPIVYQIQSDSYIPLRTRREIAQWEQDLKDTYGVRQRVNLGEGLVPCETCSGGCSDDCGNGPDIA
jgi:hypothetical protein